MARKEKVKIKNMELWNLEEETGEKIQSYLGIQRIRQPSGLIEYQLPVQFCVKCIEGI